MQVLLTTLNAKYIHTNLAIRLLYSLNKDYEGLQWKEFTIKEDKGEVSDYCAQFDVVAFSCYIWNITPTLEVAKKIKQKNPNTKILLGGPEVSYEYNNIIALPEIDYIIVGEKKKITAHLLYRNEVLVKNPNIIGHMGTTSRSRVLPKEFDDIATFTVFGDYICFQAGQYSVENFEKQGEVILFIMKSAPIAEMMRNQFKTVWKISKEVLGVKNKK